MTDTKAREAWSRRHALAVGAGLLAAAGCASAAPPAAAAPAGPAPRAPLYKISLAQWSFHRTIFDKQMDHLEFARAASQLGFDAVEYVNQFWKDRAQDRAYLFEMKSRAAGEGVWSALVMVDGEGKLGHPVGKERQEAVEKHKKWVEAAAYLGCHSVRVNAASEGSYEEQVKLAADGLRALTEFAMPFGLNVIVENHGGLSSNGKWLAQVMTTVGLPRCGTLPDFGNFRVSALETYDRYQGVSELMPFAKAVSAKSHDFDAKGDEINTDYLRMMKIVVAAGYRGYVGVEYEGKTLPEREGVLATKRLLERVRARLAVTG